MSGVALVLVGALSIVHILGTEVTRYECEDSLTGASASTPFRLFLRLEQNKHLIPWTAAAGYARIDVPGIGTFHYRQLDRTNSDITFSDPDGGLGKFSFQSRSLDVSLGDGRHFSGRCHEQGGQE